LSALDESDLRCRVDQRVPVCVANGVVHVSERTG
jgi:hypothetical protein